MFKNTLSRIKNNVAVANPLGVATKLDAEDSKGYSPKEIKKTLEEKGLSATEQVEVVNPVTGKRSMVTIERDGTPDSKLVIALTDKSLTRDQKDNVMGLYLFERGKENASFLMDLMRYKGSHTKETRAFKSQVRFDFEMFVGLFTSHLDEVAKDVFKELGIVDWRSFLEGYVKYLKEAKEDGTMRDYAASKGREWGVAEATLAIIAVRDIEEADKLRDAVKRVAQNRMADKGYGIYVDRNGKSYSILDSDIDDVIKKDKERMEELAQEDLKA